MKILEKKLRGCLSKNRPLIFVSKIDFPDILLIDRYQYSNHKNLFCFAEKSFCVFFSSIQMSEPVALINGLRGAQNTSNFIAL